jgi:hypothetical protein
MKQARKHQKLEGKQKEHLVPEEGYCRHLEGAKWWSLNPEYTRLYWRDREDYICNITKRPCIYTNDAAPRNTPRFIEAMFDCPTFNLSEGLVQEVSTSYNFACFDRRQLEMKGGKK